MEQLIELLQQIQDLAGAGVDALKGAAKEAGGGGGEKPAPEHEAAPEGEGKPPMQEGGGKPEAAPEEKPRY